ncbi:MAG: hypothetical protein ACRC8A_02860 [Microcoleaceae cyanobacterium]
MLNPPTTYKKTSYIPTNQSVIENSIIAAFIIFGFFGILNHEMWRDELQSWSLARDSHSIIELFNNMRYEGHPGLWHLCLYGLNHISHNPLIMQVFHLLISSLIVYLIVKHSPFLLLHRFLLTFSYFIFYEYTVISRNYNLGVLFIFLFCAVYSRYGTKKPTLLAAILALMANANVYALIISFALALVFTQDAVYALKTKLFARKKSWMSLIILVSGWGLSIVQIARPTILKDYAPKLFNSITTATAEMQSNPGLSRGIKSCLRAVVNIWSSYFPIPSESGTEFWRSNILTRNPSLSEIYLGGEGVVIGTLIALLISSIIAVICIRLLSEKPLVLWIYIFGSFSLIVFSGLIFAGSTRHHGHLFILLIACLWIFEAKYLNHQRLNRKLDYQLECCTTPRNQLRKKALTILLSVHFIAGLHAYSIDTFYPFSMGRETAQFIQKNSLSHLEILGMDDRLTSVISGYLNKKLYYLEVDRFGSFWRGWGEKISQQDLLQKIEWLTQQRPEGILMVLTQQLDPDLFAQSSVRVTELKRFSKHSMASEESTYIVYLAQQIDQKP